MSSAERVFFAADSLVGSLLGSTAAAGVCDLEQTGNVGTVRYMPPEVRAAEDQPLQPSNAGLVRVSRYSVQVDVFSLGMVYYFVFEGVAPSLEGATTPQAHVAALQSGKRPAYNKCPAPMRKLIDLCLLLKPRERPTSVEVVGLIAGMCLKSKGSFFSSGPKMITEEKLRATQELYVKIQARALSGPPSLRPPVLLQEGPPPRTEHGTLLPGLTSELPPPNRLPPIESPRGSPPSRVRN